MPAGRPTKYKKEFCDTVLELMREGKSIVNCCAELDISRETFYSWMEKHKEFHDTVKRGMELSEHWWQEKARENLDSNQFNSTLWYMNMKNRFKWTDKQEVEHSGGVSINITKSDADL